MSSDSRKAAKLIRPLVQRLHPYVPGEQPKIQGLVKLNTNENPYSPAPKVIEAVKRAADGRLRLYPNPTAELLREKLAKFHGCQPENIIVGNGSDELLAMAVRAFTEPLDGGRGRNGTPGPSKGKVQFFHPSYSLYPVLAATHGAKAHPVALESNFAIPALPKLKSGKQLDFAAALSFITTPNAPSGRAYGKAQLKELCAAQQGVIVLDEAYVDFARENALSLSLAFPHVLTARTFSKAYSLCFLRVGYFVGSRELIAALNKIRDSYNVNGLGQIAAIETLNCLPYYRETFRKIIHSRNHLSTRLSDLGFEVYPSQTNFILVRPPHFPAAVWLEKLRSKKILVRWFNDPVLKDLLRITIGTQAECDALISEVERMTND